MSALTDAAIDEILEHFPYINSLQYIIENICIVDSEVQEEVLKIIQECFEDFEFQQSVSTRNEDDCCDKYVFTSDSENTISDYSNNNNL